MPNIAAVLKGEIARVARKELRSHTEALKKAAAAQRAEIAALKRRLQAVEQALRSLGKASARAASSRSQEAPAKALRFSAKGLASQRKRLALSALDCGLLMGTSGQSIYNWERGQARPQWPDPGSGLRGCRRPAQRLLTVDALEVG
jgi:DNA-binding transcriptional regulator YiaG